VAIRSTHAEICFFLDSDLRITEVICKMPNMSKAIPRSYLRHMSSITASAERRLLIWMAHRLPPQITPDRLTILGLCGGILTGVGYAFAGQNTWLLGVAALGYLVHWFGDSLDGTVARVRRVERPRFGMFIDQSTDLLTVFIILAGLGFSPWVRMDVAIATYASYLLLAVLVHLRAGVCGVYDIAHDGIGPTEGRLLMILMTLLMAIVDPVAVVPWFGGMGVFDLVLAVMIIWAVVTCVREVWRVGRMLAHEEAIVTVAPQE
jgi:archaetidylinositol phosphate synthase